MQPAPLQISYTLDSLPTAAQQLWQYGHNWRVWAFSGEMGTGKTTLIHTLCNFLGVEDAVSSPTYAIANEYHFTDASGNDQLLYHMDWYRMRDANEIIDSGLEDSLLQPDARCFVEWPEQGPELLPKPYLWIEIKVTGDQERMLTATVR